MDTVDHYAKIIWDYMLMHQELKKVDVILVLGSNDIRTALEGARLYLESYAPYIVCAGGFGKDTKFEKTEAETFADNIIARGVPKDRILIENTSTNTGENILFTKKLLEKKDIKINSCIVVQKPYMERRTYATFRKQWPEVDCIVTSPDISYTDYSKGDSLYKIHWINVMVGDLIRIREYSKLGFQIEQEIPENVWQAGQELIRLGFDKYVLK